MKEEYKSRVFLVGNRYGVYLAGGKKDTRVFVAGELVALRSGVIEGRSPTSMSDAVIELEVSDWVGIETMQGQVWQIPMKNILMWTQIPDKKG